MSASPNTPPTDRARWTELTWPGVDGLDREHTVALLPVGAVEAHGPHLPLGTDNIIAEAMAESARAELRGDGLSAFILPTLTYTAAPFARAFAGTLSLRPETVTAVIVDLGSALRSHGFCHLAIANAHLDPTHLESLHRAASELAERTPDLLVSFPDVTRKKWALRLGDEFMSGACHAGRYEGSIVMASRPHLVRTDIQRELPANPSSLVTAIRGGLDSFAAAGGERAYFGAPSEATAAEGEDTIRTLGAILAEAVLADRAEDPAASAASAASQEKDTPR